MSYWNTVLVEVLNQQDPKQPTIFTNVKDYNTRSSPVLPVTTVIPSQTICYSPKPRKYPLGQSFPGVCFTQREAQVAFHFTQGLTMTKIAEVLALSPRTVEFYVNNMRSKLKCRSKSELVEKIMQSEFLALTDTSIWS